MNEPLLQVTDIHKSFGAVRALQGVSLDLYPGEVLGLVGDNGAGKSTLIKILSGFQRQDSGTVVLNGKEMRMSSPADARQAGIETVYQEQALADDLSVTRNLFLGKELRRKVGPFSVLADKKMATEASKMLADLRLRLEPDQEARYCSGGERQGIAIARAIYFNARMVILDEPTNALGVVAVERVLELIGELKTRGISCIFVSHNISHIVEVCDRVAMFVHGRKIMDSPIAEVTAEKIVSMLNAKSGSKD